MSIWSRCDMCEDYWCSIHEEHVHDCLCPDMEGWEEMGVNPYFDSPTGEIINKVSRNDT